MPQKTSSRTPEQWSQSALKAWETRRRKAAEAARFKSKTSTPTPVPRRTGRSSKRAPVTAKISFEVPIAVHLDLLALAADKQTTVQELMRDVAKTLVGRPMEASPIPLTPKLERPSKVNGNGNGSHHNGAQHNGFLLEHMRTLLARVLS